MSSYILALDLGTSSTRSALYDCRGLRLRSTTAQQTYPLRTTIDGAAELDPKQLRSAVQSCVRAALARSGKKPIIGIGVSSFWHSLLGVDSRGQPLTAVITWADSRNREQAARLRTEMSEASVHRRTGCMLRSSFWPAKLLWLRETQPKLWKKVHRWISPAEWIQEQFCGESLCSFSLASGTGLFNPNKLRWDTALLRHCHITTGQLNRVSEDSLPLSAAAQKIYPRLAAARWYPTLGDGAASNLGSGAIDGNIAAINFGTSGAVRMVRAGKSGEQTEPGLFRYCLDGKRRLIGGAISNAGNLRAWAARELNGRKSARPASVSPQHGLTVLPFLAAERAPTWPEDLPSVILGITYHTTASDLFQALTEASYHRLAQIIEKMESPNKKPLVLVVSGGLSKSADSLQRLSSVLGRSLRVSLEPEASLRGAALFALEKLGYPLPPTKFGRTFHPEKAASKVYQLARGQQSQLERALRHAWPKRGKTGRG